MFLIDSQRKRINDDALVLAMVVETGLHLAMHIKHFAGCPQQYRPCLLFSGQRRVVVLIKGTVNLSKSKFNNFDLAKQELKVSRRLGTPELRAQGFDIFYHLRPEFILFRAERVHPDETTASGNVTEEFAKAFKSLLRKQCHNSRPIKGPQSLVHLFFVVHSYEYSGPSVRMVKQN